uniref:ribonuclease H n=1 Tax=Oryzias latipes TaxID=8090 RepID=A0A3P9J671_ORYLA
MRDLRKLRVDKKVSRSYSKLVAYLGQKIQTKGKIVLKCQYKDKNYDIEFEVIKNKAPAILGGESCEEMGLVKRLHVLETENDILNEYEDLFTGLGCLPGLYHIKTDPDVSPVIHAPRKVPVALKDKIETELKRMESLGVITKQTEPTEWVNSMVTVTKPNKVRICIDPQDLNAAIKREHYPLRTIEEVVAEMPNAKYFSVLDANHGFWQIQLDDESSHLCTFNTPFGRYRFKRLPFGISSAPEVFQRCIARHLEGLEGVVNVIDDILVWGENIEQHDGRLRQLLDRIRKINLKLNKSKCKIRMTEITYIGHVLSEQGLKPDPEKVQAIQNMPAPEDKAALQRFTGLLQYLSKFIPNLSDISAPLRKLEGNVEWHWETEQQQSFEKLKTLVSQAPVLKYYDVNKPVTLSVDASSEGLGAVLLQEGQPVAYGSRALTDCQKRYAQIEKELLAIVFGCEKFHQYLYGRH